MTIEKPEIEVTDFGWSTDDIGRLHPKWTRLPKASKACKERTETLFL